MIAEDEYYCTGEESEVREYHRKIDFGEHHETERKYNRLIPEYQGIVYRVLKDLTHGTDFFGYNFKRFLKAYRHTTPSVPQLKISRLLKEVVLSEYDVMGEGDINRRLDVAKNTAVLKKSEKGSSQLEDFVNAICDDFLIDLDLLTQGIGKVAYIKDEWHKRYMQDAEFAELANQDVPASKNLRLRIQKYEAYLREKGELAKEESVLEEEWAVMTYTGMYLMLEKQKSTQNEAMAVKRLITELYVRQLADGTMPSRMDGNSEE
ncbi:MAG: hypothetical protein HFI82_12805 [Eubacterium sp.]|nr:hypothetical protein [Eubacterium sp.]